MLQLLILGTKGWIGSELFQHSRALCLVVGAFRVGNNAWETNTGQHFSSLETLIERYSNFVIVSCVGKVAGSQKELMASNVEFHLKLCNIMSQIPTNRLIMLGSAAEYRSTKGDIFYSEESTVGSATPYGKAKNAQYKVYEKFRYKLDIKYLRVFNIYGDTLNQDLLIGSVRSQCRLVKQRKADAVFTNDLRSIRDYTDVGTVCHIILKVSEMEERESNVFNLGSGRPVSAHEVVMRIFAEEDVAFSYLGGKEE